MDNLRSILSIPYSPSLLEVIPQYRARAKPQSSEPPELLGSKWYQESKQNPIPIIFSPSPKQVIFQEGKYGTITGSSLEKNKGI